MKNAKLCMLFVSSLLLLAAFSPALAIANPLTASNMDMLRLSTTSAESTNWSGYAVTTASGSVTGASGSWIVPSLTSQTTSGTDYAAFWVGIDGANSNTVEQTGILAETTSTSTTWLAWYEFYPNPMYEIVTSKGAAVPISAGDTITASVTYSASSSGSSGFGGILNSGPSGAAEISNGPSALAAPTNQFSIPGRTTGSFTITITDTSSTGSQKWTYTTQASVAGASRSSAEWIVETPTVSNGRTSSLASLAQFSPTSFSSCTATTTTTLPIGENANVLEITMVNTAGTATMASPSALGSDSASFSVTWENAGP